HEHPVGLHVVEVEQLHRANRGYQHDYPVRHAPPGSLGLRLGHFITSCRATASRRKRTASSGRVGLTKKPVPQSKPAWLVSLGRISICQWKSGLPSLTSVCSVRL